MWISGDLTGERSSLILKKDETWKVILDTFCINWKPWVLPFSYIILCLSSATTNTEFSCKEFIKVYSLELWETINKHKMK